MNALVLAAAHRLDVLDAGQGPLISGLGLPTACSTQQKTLTSQRIGD